MQTCMTIHVVCGIVFAQVFPEIVFQLFKLRSSRQEGFVRRTSFGRTASMLRRLAKTETGRWSKGMFETKAALEGSRVVDAFLSATWNTHALGVGTSIFR